MRLLVFRKHLSVVYKKGVYWDIGATIWNTDDENLCAIIYAGLLIEIGRMELMNPYAVLK